MLSSSFHLSQNMPIQYSVKLQWKLSHYWKCVYKKQNKTKIKHKIFFQPTYPNYFAIRRQETGLYSILFWPDDVHECAMTFCMIVQLWNTNTPAIVSREVELTENYTYISMKFGTGVHVFCWEVSVFNRSCFCSVSCNSSFLCVCTAYVINFVHRWILTMCALCD